MSDAFTPGEILAEKYLIERVIGQGGMGVVLAARHLQLDDRVAIKVLHPMFASQPSHVERFAREGRAAVKIKSEHVARVSDIGSLPGGSPYMVMEYLEGHDLAEHVRRCGPLPPEVAVRFVLQACEALAEAHAAGVIHRDLKPANLFLSRRADGSPCVKVLDFGISKLLEGDASLTSTHGMMGSPQYMSPEQLHSPKGVDHRTDVWALGAILFELTTGRPPYVAESIPSLVMKVSQEPPPRLRDFLPDAPEVLEGVIASCLQRDREQRTASVADLAEQLAPIAAQDGSQSIERIQRVLASVRVQTVPPKDKAPSAVPAGTDPGGTKMVSSSSMAPEGPAKRAMLPLLGGVAVVAIAAVAFLLGKSGGAHPETTSVPAVTPPPSSAPAPVPAPPPPASAETPTVAPAASSADPAGSASGKPAPKAVGAAPPTTTAKPAAPPGGCDPPYIIDADGHRKYKPACLR